MTDWIGVKDNYMDYEGFVYKITNLKTGQYYIGKRSLWKKESKPPLKGRKNRRIKYIESKWKDYWGSSNKLLSDIEKYGKHNFKREILHYCETKSERSYIELMEQLNHDVLNDEQSYNGIIDVKINRTK